MKSVKAAAGSFELFWISVNKGNLLQCERICQQRATVVTQMGLYGIKKAIVRTKGIRESEMENATEKRLSLALWVLGALMVAYGMNWNNNVVFVIGIVFVIGGYYLIRKRLKERLSTKGQGGTAGDGGDPKKDEAEHRA